MMKWIYTWLFLGWTIGLHAQVQATIIADRDSVIIGDPLEIQIIANSPKDIPVTFPSVEDILAKENEDTSSLVDRTFEFIGATEVVSREGRERDIYEQTVTITAWNEGIHIFPELPFAYKEGVVIDTYYSDQVVINAKFPALVSGDTSYVADIKPMLEEAKTIWDYWMYFAFCAALVLAAAIVWGLIELTKRGKQRKIQKRKLTPEQLALQRIKTLESSTLINEGRFKEFHTEISFLIREYLEGRFNLLALKKPTRELLESVTSEHMTGPLKTDLKEVLETADLVKFAKASPLDSANQFAIDFSNNLLDVTKRRLQEEAARKRAEEKQGGKKTV